MKIYIYSLYDRKTGELLAKGTAKELAQQHWYNSTDSVYQAYLTQKKRAGDLHALLAYNAEARRRGRPELSYGHWAAAGKPGVPVW